jgi:hypothetical protein
MKDGQSRKAGATESHEEADTSPAPRISGMHSLSPATTWRVVSPTDVTAEQLARQPHTTLKVSNAEAEWLRAVERAAKDDPEAYLARCRAQFEG